MRHWSQLAINNLRAKRVRTLGAVLAIALGAGAVVWVTCVYDSVRRTVLEWAGTYVGASHINLESPLGKWSQFAERVVPKIAALPEVKQAVPLLLLRLRGVLLTRDDVVDLDQLDRWKSPELDFNGIDLRQEFLIRDWNRSLREGRMLTEADERACVCDFAWAQERDLGVGDKVLFWPEGGDGAPVELEIVGLIERRRWARFQKPIILTRLEVLQELNFKLGQITSLDVVLHDPNPRTIAGVAGRLRAMVRAEGIQANARSAQARMQQVERAMDQQEIVLVLLASIAMLTALFIILSTLSMGMVERITQLGMLRCIGMTGAQLAALVLVEVLPLGLIGILAGVPIGLGLARATVWLVPEYAGEFTINYGGILLACVAGLATTLIAAILPALAVWRVSPMEAAHPQARPPRRWPIFAFFGLALLGLGLHAFVMGVKLVRSPDFLKWSTVAVVALYFVYALAAPLAVYLISRLAVPFVAAAVGVRVRLLQSQIGHAVWRSAGICCGLMVGLSLIVALMAFSQSIKGSWQFPKQFPQAYIFSFDQMRDDAAEIAARQPGIKDVAPANMVNVIVDERNLLLERVMLSVTWFVGCDPANFFDLVKLEFIEGDLETARRLLNRGGYLLVAADFARSRQKAYVPIDPATGEEDSAALIAAKARGLSNQVRIFFNERWHQFKIAGVIDSPALDITAGYFQADSEMRVAAAGSVLGTNADMRRLLGLTGIKLLLLNLDVPPEEPPPGWPPEARTKAARDLRPEDYNTAIPLAERYKRYREDRALRHLRDEIGAPQAYHGSVTALKDEIDRELTRITQILTAVPGVALLVAAIGVANLMTANVTARTKELAMLRAVGATRGQILRMVLGEAIVLGLLGSALGLALGLHLATDMSTIIEKMMGYRAPVEVPWTIVAIAVGLTIGLCIIAGLLPARHAARTNIIDALHVA